MAEVKLPPKPRSPKGGGLKFAEAVSLAADKTRHFHVTRMAVDAKGRREMRFLNVEDDQIFVTGVGPDRHHVTVSDYLADNWQEHM